MNLDLGAVLEEAVNRLLTPAGAVLAVLFSIAGIVQQIGLQDLVFSWVEWVISLAEESDPEQAAELERQLESSLSQSLALGLDTGPAIVVFLLGFFGGLAVLVLAIDAFGRGAEAPGAIGTDGFAWKFGNLAIGWILWIAFTALLTPVIGLGLVLGWLTMFFPVSIVLDGKSFLGAYADSFGFVREHLVASALLAVLAVVLLFATSAVQNVLSFVPTVFGQVLSQVVRSVGWTLLWAIVTVTYVSGTETSTGSVSTDSASRPGKAA